MNEKILAFEQFLIDNNVQPEYFKELSINDDPDNVFNYNNAEEYLKIYFLLKSDFILDAFNWHNAEEGHEFWSELDDKWKNLCKEYNDENIYFGFGIDININKTKKMITKCGLEFKL